MAGSKTTGGVLVDVRQAGRKGGLKRAENLTEQQRKKSARKAIAARWERYYAEHPEKLAQKEAREAAQRKKKS